MKNQASYPSTQELIATATSDDGAVTYSPIGNDRLIDNVSGRDMSRRCYLNQDGYETDLVAHAVWEAACLLMHEVDEHNNRAHEEIRNRAEQQQIDRHQDWQYDLAGDMDHSDSDK